MSDTEAQLERIEVTLEHAQSMVDKKNALVRLFDSKDFVDIISQGYFVTEASRVVLVKADPDMQTEDKQLALDKSIVAIGSLRQYFSAIMNQGHMAERSIAEDEKTREELLKEAL